MNDTNLYVNLTEQQEDALTKIEMAVESGIENCLSEGCNINDIKDTIESMIERYESEIAKLAYRDRIREHNKRIKSLNSVVGVKKA